MKNLVLLLAFLGLVFTAFQTPNKQVCVVRANYQADKEPHQYIYGWDNEKQKTLEWEDVPEMVYDRYANGYRLVSSHAYSRGIVLVKEIYIFEK